jgi:predicted esterase
MKKYTTLIAISMLLGLINVANSTPGQDSLPPLDREIAITDWWVAGPILSGSRESLVNPFAASFNRDTGEVDLDARYSSVQEYGGAVGWSLSTVDEEGNLNFSFDNPDWDKIDDEWGASGIAFMCGAYATFQCDRECRALVDANGIGSFYINGRLYSGDPYGHGLIKTPVLLDEGENRVFFASGGYGGSDTVRFAIEPPPETALMVLENDILLPDLVRGESLDTFVGVPILNTTDEWVENVEVTAGYGSTVFIDSEPFVIKRLAPLSVIKVPARIATEEPYPEEWDEDEVPVPIRITYSGSELWAVPNARVRNPEDSRKVVFLSDIDQSAQKYAVRYPSNYDPSRQYGLILALHGAGVECEGLADAFESKEWAFVVAPTNRRCFGFDWQDWGRLDAIEVLNQAMSRYPIDENRVYLVGHSMGGHGTWHVGCTHADTFAAIVPSAGWASLQLYTPWFLRSDDMFFDPELSAIFEACTSPDRTERLLPNLRNTPVLAVHGGNDDNVPPTHGRLLTGILEQMGYDATYWEEPGQGHWWDNNPDIPGAACVDALRIRSFLMEHVRNPYPRHVTLATFDLGNANTRYWVEVNEEISPIGGVYVDAEIDRTGEFTCTTHNVKTITFHFDEAFPYSVPATVAIDDQIVALDRKADGSVSLTLAGGAWSPGEGFRSDLSKTPDFRGPIKRAYFSPFVIVVGTVGTDEENSLNFEIARAISQRWWYRANGYAPIVTDNEVWSYQTANLILIGGPESNVFSKLVEDSLPIRIVDGGVMLGDRMIRGDDLAVQFVYPMPNPVNPERLVLCNWGTSIEGTRMSGGVTCLYSGSNLPDFMIFDSAVRLQGLAGVRAMGFFDNQWQLDEDFYYVR